jgi:hypothetical protein
MDLSDRTQFLTPEGARAVAWSLSRDGWTIVQVPDGIATLGDFFAFADEALPLNPPISDPRNLDAFADSLEEGIGDLGASRVAVVWPEPSAMSVAAPEDFRTVVDLLVGLTHAGHNEAEPNRIILVVGGDHYLGPTRDFT